MEYCVQVIYRAISSVLPSSYYKLCYIIYHNEFWGEYAHVFTGQFIIRSLCDPSDIETDTISTESYQEEQILPVKTQ